MAQPIKISKKVCLLGTFAVGKTSLVRQFIYQKFEESYLSTMGVQLSSKLVDPVKDPKTGRVNHVNLILWDLAHLEKFDTTVKTYLHGAHAAVVVLDLTRPQSFSEYDEIIRQFFDSAPKAKIVLVGNKSDLTDDQDARQHIQKLAADLECAAFFASAKTGENVEEMFFSLAQSLI